MKIDEILDLMDQLLDHAKPIPFASHKVIVDGDRLRELINDMRMNKPEEIRRAKLIEFDCDRIVQEAEQRAKKLVEQQTITMEARERAVEMLTKAQAASEEIKNASESYVMHLLTETEQYLNTNLQEVQQTKNRIHNRKK